MFAFPAVSEILKIILRKILSLMEGGDCVTPQWSSPDNKLLVPISRLPPRLPGPGDGTEIRQAGSLATHSLPAGDMSWTDTGEHTDRSIDRLNLSNKQCTSIYACLST